MYCLWIMALSDLWAWLWVTYTDYTSELPVWPMTFSDLYWLRIWMIMAQSDILTMTNWVTYIDHDFEWSILTMALNTYIDHGFEWPILIRSLRVMYVCHDFQRYRCVRKRWEVYHGSKWLVHQDSERHIYQSSEWHIFNMTEWSIYLP